MKLRLGSPILLFMDQLLECLYISLSTSVDVRLWISSCICRSLNLLQWATNWRMKFNVANSHPMSVTRQTSKFTLKTHCISWNIFRQQDFLILKLQTIRIRVKHNSVITTKAWISSAQPSPGTSANYGSCKHNIGVSLARVYSPYLASL